MAVNIGGLFLLVKEYFEIEKQGLAMRLGKEGGSAAALLGNQPLKGMPSAFWSRNLPVSVSRFVQRSFTGLYT